MKYCMLLLSMVTPTICLTMEPAIEKRNRNLNTTQKPYITIINLLPKDNHLFPTTRIDISDKTKTNCFIPESYKPDDSTQTIYSGQSIRFDPRLNNTGEPEHRRLGMNDAGNAALIALYIHAHKGSPCYNLLIGKGSKIAFRDKITFAGNPDGGILLKHKNSVCRIPQTIDNIEHKTIGIDETTTDNNPYINNILTEQGNDLVVAMLINLSNALEIKNCEDAIQQFVYTEKADGLDQLIENSTAQDICEFMFPDSPDASDVDEQ